MSALRNHKAAAVLTAWTLFVWVGRVRNVLADDELSGGGLAWRVALASTFIVLAAATAIMIGRQQDARLQAVVRALVGFTVAVWLIRGVGILIDGDHETAFKIVHSVLAVVSIGLAAWTWRSETNASHSASAPVVAAS